MKYCCFSPEKRLTRSGCLVNLDWAEFHQYPIITLLQKLQPITRPGRVDTCGAAGSGPIPGPGPGPNPRYVLALETSGHLAAWKPITMAPVTGSHTGLCLHPTSAWSLWPHSGTTWPQPVTVTTPVLIRPCTRLPGTDGTLQGRP